MGTNRRWAFYPETISRWIPDRQASVLVVAGGLGDRDVFRDLGFRNVVISNMDERTPPGEFAPFAWRREDAQKLNAPANSYDYVVEHNGLHHLHSPHLGLTEMYRVARKGVVFFEARDSMAMSVARRLRIAGDYEQSAVFSQDGKHGGVNNTHIPNYIYRWTEREVEKTIASYDPTARHVFRYRHGATMPFGLTLEKGRGRLLMAALISPFFKTLTTLFRGQGNQFAAMIEKPAIPEALHPWLTQRDGELHFNFDWARRRYRAGVEGAHG